MNCSSGLSASASRSCARPDEDIKGSEVAVGRSIELGEGVTAGAAVAVVFSTGTNVAVDAIVVDTIVGEPVGYGA